MKATRFFSAISASPRFQIDRAPFRVSGFVAEGRAMQTASQSGLRTIGIPSES